MSETIKLFQQDALELLSTIQDESVQVVITDPPYWTLDKWRNVGTTARMGFNRNKDDQRPEMFYETIDREYLWSLFLELDRVLSLDGHLYMFCDDIVAPILLNWIREAQEDHRFGEAHMLIWDKVNQGMGYHYRRRYECIIFAWREKRDGVKPVFKRKLADLGIPDVLAFKRVVNSYPTEKPVDLVKILVSQSARRNEVLLDPFAGSGVLAAATDPALGATILLNDKSDTAFSHIERRLAGRNLEAYRSFELKETA